ncbi:MAG: hypothetical protein IJR29_08275 [Butyrivibrio sp.]|nr:hypothetical protein [Butyrivibrio sp.]
MKIFILSPQKRVSGGPELAHQLCSAINRLTGVKAYMSYVNLESPYNIVSDADTPEQYKLYNVPVFSDINEIDRPENVVIFPEGLTYSLNNFSFSKKVLWWMSVDNYIESTKEKNLSYIKSEVSLHLYQSYYAMDYVNKVLPGVKGLYLSDYINDEHGKFIYPAELRQNLALYNPAKGYEELKPLMEKANWLKWVPLTGLNISQIILMMQAGKVYVDFGNHPGKDRIPREAAANGCCVITNKKGSAAYAKDVPIPEEYKFESPSQSLDELDKLLHEICDNFALHQNNFADYRKFISKEKENFETDTIKFIERLKQES